MSLEVISILRQNNNSRIQTKKKVLLSQVFIRVGDGLLKMKSFHSSSCYMCGTVVGAMRNPEETYIIFIFANNMCEIINDMGQ